MSRSALKRALGSLRRSLRRRRAPSPSEQEWLRLILLVRRLQRGQLAFVQRLDEIRALTGAVGSFRSDFGALQEELGAVRDTAAELDRGLGKRLERLDALPDPKSERADVDRRLGFLDTLTARLETLAAQAPGERAASPEVGSLLARLSELAARFEGAQAAERAVGGQDELARLYERIQEMAEQLARPARESAAVAATSVAGFETRFERLSEQLLGLQGAVQGLKPEGGVLERLEELTAALERRAEKGEAAPALAGVLERFEQLAERLELQPALLPELPPETVVQAQPHAPAPDAQVPATARGEEELRTLLVCEQETRRALDAELQGLRDKLRASELARVELETRHATELTQMADHVQRQLHRVEDDLKKKKRGLAELTQQNIALQTQVARLTKEAASLRSDVLRAPLPSGGSEPLGKLMGAEPGPADATQAPRESARSSSRATREDDAEDGPGPASPAP